ncbi:hypothetical protein HD806DRAFT_531708 [Xylariaceae sp. AK1471]|nr:hypothetical protein HD806DRAFT_531708 [Xylariaceae sp. AK1471]
MRALTLAADLVSVALLLGCVPRVFAFTNRHQDLEERYVSNEDATEQPYYNLYGGPPPNRDAYAYPSVTYGGYGPPPPPSSSDIIPSMSSGFSESIAVTATSSVLSTGPSDSTFKHGFYPRVNISDAFFVIASVYKFRERICYVLSCQHFHGGERRKQQHFYIAIDWSHSDRFAEYII